ncbi:MAG: glycogen-binding domain-containing protein [Planctomycetota bacterium]|nr:glycogen-binding domain-containing protein [Planctomycetota bacterium]
MIEITEKGAIAFELRAESASVVELVGDFDGWDEQSRPMHRESDSVWRLVLDPGPGVYLFRYRIDDHQWRLDDASHGIITTWDGIVKSRVFRPGFEYVMTSLAA